MHPTLVRISLAGFLAGSSCLLGAEPPASLVREARMVDFPALRRAITDLEATYPDTYPGETLLPKLDAYEKALPGLLNQVGNVVEIEIPKTGAWISQGATYESSPLMSMHSQNKDKLLTGDCPTEWAFHSLDPADKPWIVVDLGAVKTVGGFQALNRRGFEKRSAKMVMSVSKDKTTWTEVWRNDQGVVGAWGVNLKTPVETRYVKFWLDERNTFHLKSLKLCAPLEKEVEAPAPAGRDQAVATLEEIVKFRREALLANPLLTKFDQVFVVKRGAGKLGLPANWQGNSSTASKGYDNEIDLVDFKKDGAPAKTFFKPQDSAFVGDLDLNFDADKMLFSMPGTKNRWQVFEIKSDGSGLRQVTDPNVDDYDSYDACYLPDGRVIFCATMGYQGVPCVGGADYVGNLCLMNADGTGLRRLTYDQDHNWSPTVKNDGLVMYQRWEYTDSAHYFSRLIFDMYPDGREQRAMYGSNSYWPNSIFYARPIPGENNNNKFVGIVTGHHGVARMGELVLFDTAKGRHEADGAVQRIPGYGKKVEPIVKDQLVNNSWPRFLHPYPLSDKYFLVSCQPTPSSFWGLYLVDSFDNMLLLKETPGYAILEPIPFTKTVKPPVIPDRVDTAKNEATVYISDIYTGPGLRGVPRGTVKSLLIYAYEYAFRNTGSHAAIGFEGPWEVRKVIGTVPVYEDGSASFKIPSNVPVAVLPLDAAGESLQMFRSWFVGMPGEIVSCVGCHEERDTPPPRRQTIAVKTPPAVPTPWKGPFRGFSFERDIQPVLNTYCVGCHNDKGTVPLHSGTSRDKPDFRGGRKGFSNFDMAYLELMPYIRRNGPEGTWNVLTPLEFHGHNTQLFQMLRKGHHGVKLDQEAWERLEMWVNMNVPNHGTWNEYKAVNPALIDRTRELRKKYAGVEVTSEDLPKVEPAAKPFVMPTAQKAPAAKPDVAGWPLSADQAREAQAKLGKVDDSLDLGNGQAIALKKLPAGRFAMGNAGGFPDEDFHAEMVAKPFWIGTTEVTLKQYRQFQAEHKNGFYDMHHKDQVRQGYNMDADESWPAIRISEEEAIAFCDWLSKKSGRKVRLPTETEWEWACRAGSADSHFYGDDNADFGPYANLADLMMRNTAVNGVDPQPVWRVNGPQDIGKTPKGYNPYFDFEPRDPRFYDGVLHLAKVGSYKPNAWGLYDMHGNVSEWTSSDYAPYGQPVNAKPDTHQEIWGKVVRGGSWYDRPYRAASGFRLAYPAWQQVFNVGFRIVVEE